MQTGELWCDDEPDLLPIVVGIHLDAELYDRPLAARLAETIRRWQHAYCDEPICRPTVVTDALYFGSDVLQRRPALCLGHPRINALSAALCERLPVVYSKRGRLAIQAEFDVDPVLLCAWADCTCDGIVVIDRLIDVELDDFMEALAETVAAV